MAASRRGQAMAWAASRSWRGCSASLRSLGTDSREKGAAQANKEEDDDAGWTMGEVCNASNALSMARLAASPVIAAMLVHGQTQWALAGAAAAGASDWLDGWIAKRWKQQSVLGSYLDPIADKALVGCVAAALCYKGTLSPWLLQATIARDALLVSAAFAHRRRTVGYRWPGWREFFRTKPGSTASTAPAPYVKPIMSSKINTALQILLIMGCMTHEMWEVPETADLHKLEYAVGATTLLSLANYAWAYRKGKILVK